MPEHDNLNPIDVRSEAFADFMADYPYASDVSGVDELPLQLLTADDTRAPFQARVLGFGSSYRESHLNHAPGAKPAKGVRCSGCRWTDTAILWAQPLVVMEDGMPALAEPDEPWQYVFVSFGKSAIPGEWQRDTIVWTRDATEVLRKCFVPTKAGFSRDKGAKAIPPHNADAFRQAASINDEFASLLEQYADAIPEVTAPESDPLAGL